MRSRYLTLLSAALLFLSNFVSATTIRVPADQPTIQAGIDAASDSDTVLVAPGTYTGEGNRDIDFIWKGVVLKSEGGANVTIIDCEDEGRGIGIFRGEDSAAVVDGFTIRDGYARAGAGIYISSSSPTIINNIIRDNVAEAIFSGGQGGGIYCGRDSNPVISNNTIIQNSASGIYRAGGVAARYIAGGGIYCESGSSPIIRNNTINRNDADGIYVGEYTIWLAGKGGGIYCYGSDALIIGNVICRNNADVIARGILCNNSSPVIESNTIFGNGAADAFAPGISCINSSSPVVSRTILRENGVRQISADESSLPQISFCNIQGGWEGEGNIDADPMFCDRNNDDYHLDAFSPCAPGVQPNIDLIGALGVGCGTVICGDADGSGELTPDDLQRVFDFYYGLIDAWPFPVNAGDMDCDGVITIADIVMLAGYIHGYGPLPCCAPPTKRIDLPGREAEGGPGN